MFLLRSRDRYKTCNANKFRSGIQSFNQKQISRHFNQNKDISWPDKLLDLLNSFETSLEARVAAAAAAVVADAAVAAEVDAAAVVAAAVVVRVASVRTLEHPPLAYY